MQRPVLADSALGQNLSTRHQEAIEVLAVSVTIAVVVFAVTAAGFKGLAEPDAVTTGVFAVHETVVVVVDAVIAVTFLGAERARVAVRIVAVDESIAVVIPAVAARDFGRVAWAFAAGAVAAEAVVSADAATAVRVGTSA